MVSAGLGLLGLALQLILLVTGDVANGLLSLVGEIQLFWLQRRGLQETANT